MRGHFAIIGSLNQHERERGGFDIQIDKTHLSTQLKAICSGAFVCCKEGYSKASNEGRTRVQKRLRARAVIAQAKHDKWVVSRCGKEHTHQLVGRKKMT